MAIVLYRVDERLIHGQVTVGWGNRLHPDRYVVVDDVVAGSEWEQEIHALGVPDGCASDFLTVTEARGRLDTWRVGSESVILLTRDLDHMLRLASGGRMRGEAVNLGGCTIDPGGRKFSPTSFWTETIESGSMPWSTRGSMFRLRISPEPREGRSRS